MSDELLDDPRLTAVGLLAETFIGLMNRLTAQLETHGLSGIAFEVLLRLARSPGNRLRMSDLAAQTSLSTSGATRVVDRMERDGLVTRTPCPTDRRSSYAVVSEAGMALLHEALPGHLELVERWFTGQLDPAALRALLDGLRTVRDAIHPDAVAGAAAETDGT
ncbi:MarR family transcriptional regulator [Micromonospora sp. NPDC049559]|uniref:MarR family winged helix-turn-helix transcriptional regulator n=1 Tax=Micromonospora sp. NPDC049559 TaxID=3155923 RepID=UPI00342CB9EF